MQLTMDEKLVSQTAPISKTRIGTGRIISGLLVLFFNRKSQTRERLHHTGGARHRYGKHVGIYEKQSRDRQEALPRKRELAPLVLSLPPGRGSATFLKRPHIYVAQHSWHGVRPSSIEYPCITRDARRRHRSPRS
jgi:hypothetical protein